MLAHRRLSILDLSETANQPMCDRERGQVIAYNGEVYNFKDLRQQLEAQGSHFVSSGDTEVVLRWLALRGPDSLSRLRGMFAIALWIPEQGRLLLARDPLGIKPLYYCKNPAGADADGWTLMFASEVRALLAARLLDKPSLDPTAVASVLWNGFVMGPGSAVRGVRSIGPGEYRIFDVAGRERTQKRYWSIPNATRRQQAADVVESLRDSVRVHQVSDVPLGVFLSAGIDSSSVANLAHRTSSEDVRTFTLAFEEEAYDEGRHARRIARAIGTKHTEIMLTESDFIGGLERALGSLDQPSFDGLNSYYISRSVRDAGLKVALIGTGGDELFGGYTSFRDLSRWARLAPMMKLVHPALRSMFARGVTRIAHGKPGRVPPQLRWAKLEAMFESPNDLLRSYQLSYALFLPEFHEALLGAPVEPAMVDGLPRSMSDALRAEIAGRSCLSAISALELRCFLAERLLRDTDAASMAVSLEVRLPLVDTVVMQAVAGVPDDQRYHPLGQKRLLRRAGLEGLHPDLFKRKKTGFVLPFSRWIRSELGSVMEERLRDESLLERAGLNPAAVTALWEAFQAGAPGIYWSRVWVLFALLDWCSRYDVWLSDVN